MDDKEGSSGPVTLKCLYTNIDSFTNKKDELLLRLVDEDPDVVAVTEINQKRAGWIIVPQELQLSGYDMFFNSDGRGVALFIRDSLPSREIVTDTGFSSSVWCEVRLGGRYRVAVGSVYRSPNSEADNDCRLNQIIESICSGGYTHVLMMGDLNYPGIDWASMVSSDPASHPSHAFVDCVQDNYLYQHVDRPTHYRDSQTPNVLDLVFTSEENMIDDIKYNPPIGKSHHLVLSWTYRCRTTRPPVSTQPFRHYYYDRADFSTVSRHLSEVGWTNLLKRCDTEGMWSRILNELNRVIDQAVPNKQIRPSIDNSRYKKKPAWFNDSLLEPIRDKKRTFTKYRRSRTEVDRRAYVVTRNRVSRVVREAIRKYETQIAAQAKKNPKKFFQIRELQVTHSLDCL